MNYEFLNTDDIRKNIEIRQEQLNKENLFLDAMVKYNSLLELEKKNQIHDIFNIKFGYDYDTLDWYTNIFSMTNIHDVNEIKIECFKSVNLQLGENLKLTLKNNYNRDIFEYMFKNNEDGRVKFLKDGLADRFSEFNSLYLQKKLEKSLNSQVQESHKKRKI